MRKILLVMMVMLMLTPVLAMDYWHSNDYYSLEMDGEGDVFVLAHLNFESMSDKNISEIVLEIPGRPVEIYKITQYVNERICTNWRYETPYCPPDMSCTQMMIPKCEYYSYKSGLEFLDFEKQVLSDSVVVRIYLKQNITPGSNTGISLIYQAHNIAKKTYQGYDFDFKTIRDNHALTRQLYANVIVPRDMVLKGKPEGKVDYRPSFIAAEAMGARSAEELSTVIRPGSYPYPSNQYNANNIDPGESFRIKGLYGDRIYLLYLWEIIGTVIGAIIFIAFVRRFKALRKIKEIIFGKPVRKEFTFSRMIVFGLLSGFLFIVSYYISVLLFGLTSNLPYQIRNPVGMLLILSSVLLVGASFFGPLIYVYKKFNWQEALGGAIVAILFAIGLLIFISLIFYPLPIYMSSPTYVLERAMTGG